MAVMNLYGARGTLVLPISSDASVIKVDATLAGIIAAAVAIEAGPTWFAIYTNNIYELVKVVDLDGQFLAVERGQGNTLASPFAAGTTVEFVVTAEAILASLGDIGAIVVEGAGIASVESAGETYTVTVEAPTFEGTGGVEVTGTWPNYEIHFTKSDCCGNESGEGGTGIASLEFEGIANGYVEDGVGYISVDMPNFNSSSITITGTWPNISFEVDGGSTSGTVTVVQAGAGITILGDPTDSPTVAITNTGVNAGTYGGIEINARGQIVSVPATLNPVSIITVASGSPITVDRTDDAVEFDIDEAGIDDPGVVGLVDHTDPFDNTNETQAMTPAATQVALDTLRFPDAVGVSSYSGEADGDYTNIISASSTPVVLLDGQKALVLAHVTMLDGSAPLTPVDFGIAIFDSAAVKIASNKKMNQSSQSLMFYVTGPIASITWALATTAIPGGSSVVSYSLTILKL